MTESMFMPCDDWSEKLNASSEDLSVSDLAALEAHLKVCPACLLVSIDHKMISRLIHALPSPDFGIGLSPRLTQFLQQEDVSEARALQKSMPVIDIQQQALEVVSEVLQRPGKEEMSETPLYCSDCFQMRRTPRIHRHSWGTRINGPSNQDTD